MKKVFTLNKILGVLVLMVVTYTAIPLFQNQKGCVDAQCMVPAQFPVGTIFRSIDPTDPSIQLGYGDWTQIPGRFLVGVGTAAGKTYALGETGGSKDEVIYDHIHNVTDNRHTHRVLIDTHASSSGAGGASGEDPGGGTQTRNSGTGITIDANTGGSDGIDQNLPPYYAVYIWKRTG